MMGVAMVSKTLTIAIAAVLSLLVTSANASPLNASLGEIPFGPFNPRESIDILGSITNQSPDQALTICEGICLGDANTFSLGAFAFSPTGYSFAFGNGGNSALGFLDGQIAGSLAPGETKDFIFGIYKPVGGFANPGIYSFGDQLQIFAATVERPMIGSSSFSGTFQVTAIPEPASFQLFTMALVILAGIEAARRRKHRPRGTSSGTAWQPTSGYLAPQTWQTAHSRNACNGIRAPWR